VPRGQSVPREELITPENAAANAGRDLELTETEDHGLTAANSSLHDHQYAVLFPKNVQKRPYICKLCGKMFDLRKKLRRHLSFHEIGRKHPPTMDDRTNSALSQTNTELARSDSVVDHATIQILNVNEPSSDDVGAVYKLCGWMSDKSMSLEEHAQSRGREKLESEMYVCDTCGMVFRVRSEFLKHIERDHITTPTGVLGYNQSASVQEEHSTSAVAARAICDICGWVCRRSSKTTSQVFLDHMRSHTGERPFKCAQCSLTFPRRKNLRSHEMTHESIRQFLCQYCAQSYRYKPSLWAHMYRKHADKLDPDPSKRPFTCRFCGERFYAPNHIRQHIHKQHRSDSGQLFGCAVCGKLFGSKHRLVVHERIHSGAERMAEHSDSNTT